MIMNKWKGRQKVLIFMLAMLFLLGTGIKGAYAVYYSVNAGCARSQAPYSTILGFTTFGTVTNASDSSLASGMPVQYINASGSYIVGPHGDGSVGAGETVVQSFTVGDDAEQYNSFSSLDGKFYHGITGQTDINNFYVRAWDGDPGLAGSRFGESAIFSATTNSDTPPVPNETALSDFKVMFPKLAPDTPSGLEVMPPPGSTSSTANFNASFGARYYVISWGTDTNASNGSTSTSYNTQRYPSPNSTTGKSIGMSPLLDDTDYYVKVRAGNSFGESDWSSVVAFHTTTLPDPTAPQTVTDLRVSGTGSSAGTYTVTLKWTAPYDTDRLNNHVNVSGYDIRYSANPILASTLEGFGDWYAATSFDPTYATPAPLTPGTEQEVTVTGLSSGTKFFAIKSKDPYNWSAMSNVTGAQLGAAGGGFTGLTTIEPGWNLIASGQGTSMLLDNSNLHESGGYAGGLSDGDLIYQHIPKTSDFNEAYLTTGGWIDVNTSSAPTWEIDPDRGYFYKRNSQAGQFTWQVRPKPNL
jgi:hypothetical protein